MLGSTAIISLTLLFSGVSYASPDTLLPHGIDGTNGPQDLYKAAELSGNIELVNEKREDNVALRKVPNETPELEALAADLPQYESFAVVGDSYSSGDGAFGGWGRGNCKRNKGSHGSRLNSVLKPTTFAYLPCSGAPVGNILKKQVETKAFGTPDLVTMTAGGDNGGIFVKILMACILHKSSKKCDKALKVGEATLLKLPSTLTPVYEAIMNKTGDDGVPPKVLHLGYVKMWARDTPKSECPKHGTDVSWASNGVGGYRDQINELIVRINQATKEEADKHGVTFVDVDPYFEGHRLCDGQDASWLQHRLTLRENGVLCHPTLDGHTAYMNASLHALKGEKLVNGSFVPL
ncbi:hypothetical protein FKW77_000997 [Venturia effusa]|uniref:SGNH hydrolase-type esterase domain-containing protein n=1 Tax=Venturia effusa TaxID=50376 RepID=A0A517LPI8_9PEZI|nr:hypothetical protein FKW77_000997 [Venturia effusa]